jgi:hypothetical protein
MPSLKILCTRKSTHPETHLRVTHVGGTNSSSIPWTLTLQEAIRTIELRQYNFFVARDGRRTEVQVAQTVGGEKYLRCAADGPETSVLLSLPDCP